ncbi:MAG: DUF1295 domain-containing protein [Bacteroidota bacterium]
MLSLFLFSLGFNLLLFLVAYLLRTDKLTDIAYSLTFILLVIYSYYASEQSEVDLIFTIAVGAWGLRLGGFLLYRILRIGRDQRFDNIRENFVSFLGFWLMQGITCFIVLLPVLLVHQSTEKSGGFLFGFGLGLAFTGWLFEAIADYQKFTFKQANPDTFMNKGVWANIQHANYTGELFFWWALFMASMPYVHWYVAILGPIWISFIIVRFSGISILQQKWEEKYGEDPEFRAWKERSWKLVPYVY